MATALRSQPWKRIVLLTLLAGAAALVAQSKVEAQVQTEKRPQMDVVQLAPPHLDHQSVMVDQIQPRNRPAVTKIEPVPHRPVRGKEAASTLQLPADLHSVSDDPDQETGLTSPDTTSPDLLTEVARAWHVIRNRGQQPTPELIAREIGPDMLTAFLNQYPNGVALITAQEAPTAPTNPNLPPERN